MYKLPTELVNKFADTFKRKKTKEASQVYGYVSIIDGSIFVKIDGGYDYTPAVSTIDVADGDRVIIRIDNHRCTIVNDISSPVARNSALREVKKGLDDISDTSKTSFALKNLDNVSLDAFCSTMVKNGIFSKYVKLSDPSETSPGVIMYQLSDNAVINGSSIICLGDNGLFNKMNTSGATESQTDANSINGSIIKDFSIPPNKIDTTDVETLSNAILNNIPDTGWVELSLQSSFENNGTNKLSYRNRDTSVNVCGIVKRTAGLPSSQILTILPKKIAPKYMLKFIFLCDNDRICYATLSSIGILNIDSVYNPDGTKSTTELKNIYVNINYVL